MVQLIESYFLTPKIMGEKTGLHPVVVIVSIFFWGTALGGILGMIFGIPLTAFLIILWRLLCKNIFVPRSVEFFFKILALYGKLLLRDNFCL